MELLFLRLDEWFEKLEWRELRSWDCSCTLHFDILVSMSKVTSEIDENMTVNTYLGRHAWFILYHKYIS